MIDFDTRLGQLAIARGMLRLGDLLRSVEEAGRTGRDVSEVLLLNGHLSNAEIVDLEQRLATSDSDLQAELERGHTIVLDELYQSVLDEGGIPAAVDTGDEGDATTTLEFIAADLELANEDRYELKQEIGRGGMGRVHLAKDLILQRSVAIKTLIEDAQTAKGRERLLVEAQVTGLLEHPSIVPVYDLRATKAGEPFYTMRFVQEKSLEELLSEIRRGEATHSLTFLVSILRQVSLAIQFAHDIGVVHRDLKPENVLVGKYGEVYVIDWGVAKIVSADIELESTGKVVMGQLVGTPAYMAPEQARGDNDAVNELSDVYALGAILYEILTLEPMFDADHVLAILFQIVHDTPLRPSERAPDRAIPHDLKEICLRALRKPQEARFRSAQAFADELELFLEGVKERERQQEMAEDALMQGTQVRAVFDEVRQQYAETLSELYAERNRVESWASPEDKKQLWALEQQAEDLEVEIERRFGEVVRIYGQALVHLPQMPEARRALADLYWQRFRERESTGKLAQAAYFEGLVRQYSDGVYDDQLEGTAQIRVTTEPPGAEVAVYRFQQVDRRLVEWRIADVGPTPIEELSVPHGSYVLKVERDGYTDVSAPVLVDRASQQHVHIKLYPSEQIPDDYVIIPRGPFITGKINPGGEIHRAELGDFAIARYPVTVQEYLDFLNDLVAQGKEELALKHQPQFNEQVYFARDEDGRFGLLDEDPEGDAWAPDWPIVVVNFHAATAYAAWLAEKEQRPYRLPSLLEWEKAARGVDGRVYAWGNHFDAAFCAMRDSRKGRSTPVPVGTYAIDRSPYGVMDVCGNVAEWTTTPEEGSEGVHYLGGASYNSFSEICRFDFVLSSPTVYSFGHYGFRVALSLDG